MAYTAQDKADVLARLETGGGGGAQLDTAGDGAGGDDTAPGDAGDGDAVDVTSTGDGETRPGDLPDGDGDTTADTADDTTADDTTADDTTADDLPRDAGDASDEDPAIARNLAAIKRAEERSIKAIATERAKLEQLGAELAPKLEAVERLERLQGQVWTRTEDMLDELGVGKTAEDLESFARHVYNLSKARSGDARAIAATAAERRQRQGESELAEVRRENAELRGMFEQRQLQEKTDAYLNGVVGAMDAAAAPTLATLQQRNPARARQRIAAVAHALYQDTGELPDAMDVLAELEQLLAREREELGAPASTPPPKPPNPAAETKQTGKPLTHDIGNSSTARAPDRPMTREEHEAVVLRKLEAGAFEI